jgi:hypothetical protein
MPVHWKLWANWVPRMSTEELKPKRMCICLELLERYDREGDEFLWKNVTETKVGCIISRLKTRDSQWNVVTKARQHYWSSNIATCAGRAIPTSFRDVDIVVHSKGIHTGAIISKHYFGTLQEMEGAYLKSSSWHADSLSLNTTTRTLTREHERLQIHSLFHCLGPPTLQHRLRSVWLPSLSEPEGTPERKPLLVRRWSTDTGQECFHQQNAQFYRDGSHQPTWSLAEKCGPQSWLR